MRQRVICKIKKARAVLVLFALLAVVPSVDAKPRWLYIAPVTQQTLSWCWAAVSEMVLKHYRIESYAPDISYQCGIVETLGGLCLTGCEKCVVGIPTIFDLSTVIQKYQKISRPESLRHSKGRFLAIPKKLRLSPRQIINEVNNDDPIVAVISPNQFGSYYPPGMGEHVALITGYEELNGKFFILVNDPMPFGAVGYDPYLELRARQTVSGQYWIEYDIFVHHLNYTSSIVFERS